MHFLFSCHFLFNFLHDLPQIKTFGWTFTEDCENKFCNRYGFGVSYFLLRGKICLIYFLPCSQCYQGCHPMGKWEALFIQFFFYFSLFAILSYLVAAALYCDITHLVVGELPNEFSQTLGKYLQKCILKNEWKDIKKIGLKNNV